MFILGLHTLLGYVNNGPCAQRRNQRLSESSRSFAQRCEIIVLAMVVTTVQAMGHPVRSLRPSPTIASESVCQAALCFPAP